ncbi:MAG: hypothetical protein H7332_03275 [Bdellovibrionales bacterium]|nr:hypothetical protein [Ramlibacter sp.]
MKVERYKMKPGETMFGGGKGIILLNFEKWRKMPPVPEAKPTESDSVPEVIKPTPPTSK